MMNNDIFIFTWSWINGKEGNCREKKTKNTTHTKQRRKCIALLIFQHISFLVLHIIPLLNELLHVSNASEDKTTCLRSFFQYSISEIGSPDLLASNVTFRRW